MNNRFNQGRSKTPQGIARHEAQEAGLKFYNGTVCPIDPKHGTIRYTNNGTCVECNKAYSADARAKEKRRIWNSEAARKRTLEHGALKGNPTNFKHRVFVLGAPASVQSWLDKTWKIDK